LSICTTRLLQVAILRQNYVFWKWKKIKIKFLLFNSYLSYNPKKNANFLNHRGLSAFKTASRLNQLYNIWKKTNLNFKSTRKRIASSLKVHKRQFQLSSYLYKGSLKLIFLPNDQMIVNNNYYNIHLIYKKTSEPSNEYV
jgi:hypothetical protein